jgi:hypothetical protein
MTPGRFFLAGAPKSGTTWLYRNLAASPGVFLTPNKEPRYYSVEEGEPLAFRGPGDAAWMSHFVRRRSEYETLYAGAAEGQVRGEASSDYLYRSHVAAPRIAADFPEARIIVLLRDPVLRAHSNWLHHVRDGRERLSFGEAIEAEPERVRSGWAWWWHCLGRGFYARQLEPFLERFPADQLLLLSYDDLRRDPQSLLRRVGDFLEVEVVAPAGVGAQRNASLVPRSRLHGAALRALRPNAAARRLLPARARSGLQRRVSRAVLHRPAISNEDHLRLRRAYAADVQRLSTMVDLDLSGW